MNSALSNNLSTAIHRIAPSFKISGDEVSTRLLAVLFPIPTITMPTVAAPPPAPVKVPVMNLVGLNPTLQKKLVQLFDEFNGKGNEDAYADAAGAFLAHANRMPAKEWSAKSPAEHLREFLKPHKTNAAAPTPTPAPPPKVSAPAVVEVDENCVAVLYKDREYWVGEDSKRVYEETAEGVNEFRGMLGLAEFDGMVMPVDE
jgi:hypothetical protein